MPNGDGRDELEEMLHPDKLRIAHLETVLWKLVQASGAPQGLYVHHLERFTEDEVETLWEMRQQPCPICGGTGQDGMSRDGQPRQCHTCKGRAQW